MLKRVLVQTAQILLRGRRVRGPVLPALLLVAVAQPGTAEAAPGDLGEFWPLGAPPRTWDLIARAQAGNANPRILMRVQNETTEPGRFILWFSHKEGQVEGERDGERYRRCRLPGRTWLFFDTYVKSSSGKPLVEHPVTSDRVLLSRPDGAVTDVIEDGEYAACGGTGQPYLLWSGAPWHYRIQVWGHLTENAKYKWYWDATVIGPQPVVDECTMPPMHKPAVMVQEAWWDNYKSTPGSTTGKWALGSGGMDAQTGLPSGTGLTYGRTVWHGAGQLPYLMTGKTPAAAAQPNWCVSRVSAG